jgi:hypothetical protein
VDNIGIQSTQDSSLSKAKPTFIACASFFILLCTWFAIPFGSSGDMDYHMASIWCARGEKPGICANIDQATSTAEVPFMFQMCNGRNIDWYPYCEFEEDNPPTQRLRIAAPQDFSFYYKIVNIFAGENIQQSVLQIRLFNSMISVLVLAALLLFTSPRLKFASITGLSFSLIPYGPQFFSGVTTRGWAILGVMTSWAFLASYLETEQEQKKLRMLQMLAFMFSVSLVAMTRIDTLMMVLITSLVVVIAHFLSATPQNKKQLLLGIAGIGLLAIFSQFLPIVKDLAYFTIPNEYGFAQYWLFQIVHVPEFAADWWKYNVGQSGSGPGIVGLIGVALFAINFAFALQKSDFFQRLITVSFTLIVFVFLAKSSSVANSLVPLSGFYTFGLAVPWLGITIASSKNPLQFMAAVGNRRTAISLLSFSYSIHFYSLLEFYTRRGKNLEYFNSISLNGEWWWNIGIGPNVVFFIAAIMFPVFLVSVWRTVSIKFPVKQALLISHNKF